MRIFEIEVIPIMSLTSNDPVHYQKVVLIRNVRRICGDVFDEEGDSGTATLLGQG